MPKQNPDVDLCNVVKRRNRSKYSPKINSKFLYKLMLEICPKHQFEW